MTTNQQANQADVDALMNVNNSLDLLQTLRVSIYSLFSNLSKGPSADELENASDYLRGIQHRLVQMDNAFSDLQNSANSLPSHNPAPSNAKSIALEPEDDKFQLFQQLISSYSWNRRTQEYASSVYQQLKENQLKRSGPTSGYVSKRTKKSFPEVHNVQPQNANSIIQLLTTRFPETTFSTHRPMGISTILVMSIGRVMKVILTMRGLLAERVIIKGFSESTVLDNGQVDIWSESKFKVFRLVQCTVQAAMLHYNQPCTPEISLYNFVAWLHGYKDLFTGECTYCGKILNNYLPPTGRLFVTRNSVKYHPQCHSSIAT